MNENSDIFIYFVLIIYFGVFMFAFILTRAIEIVISLIPLIIFLIIYFFYQMRKWGKEDNGI